MRGNRHALRARQCLANDRALGVEPIIEPPMTHFKFSPENGVLSSTSLVCRAQRWPGPVICLCRGTANNADGERSSVCRRKGRYLGGCRTLLGRGESGRGQGG